MKKQLAMMLVLIFVLTFPASSFAFYILGDINEYLSYDRLYVISLQDEIVFHPRVEGRLINRTDKKVYVVLQLNFCDIFNQRHNRATISISMQPNEKVVFKQGLEGSEWERTRVAHHVDFQIERLIVDGRIIVQ